MTKWKHDYQTLELAAISLIKICQLILTILICNNGKRKCICGIAWLFKEYKNSIAISCTRQTKSNYNPCLVIQQYPMLLSFDFNTSFVSVPLLRVQVRLLQKELRNSSEQRSKMTNPTINRNVKNANRHMLVS